MRVRSTQLLRWYNRAPRFTEDAEGRQVLHPLALLVGGEAATDPEGRWWVRWTWREARRPHYATWLRTTAWERALWAFDPAALGYKPRSGSARLPAEK